MYSFWKGIPSNVYKNNLFFYQNKLFTCDFTISDLYFSYRGIENTQFRSGHRWKVLKETKLIFWFLSFFFWFILSFFIAFIFPLPFKSLKYNIYFTILKIFNFITIKINFNLDGELVFGCTRHSWTQRGGFCIPNFSNRIFSHLVRLNKAKISFKK